MSKHRILSLIAAGSLASFSPAQETPVPAPALTDQQVSVILQQLKELEATIARQRGENLGAILQKLRTGASSDAAALALFAECEKIISVERKELTKEEERRREETMKREADRNKETKDQKEEGDFGAAVKLQLQYLILSLEAHETPEIKKMHPKLASYIQDLVANAEKLKGRAGDYLRDPLRQAGGGARGGRGGGGRGNPFVPAFQLERYLEMPNWSQVPVDFEQIWDKTVLPYYREKDKEDLGAQWDVRINAETAFRKGSMSEPEFLLWQQNELPAIKWERAKDIYANSYKPVDGMADMLRLIKEAPGHPDAPQWVRELRDLVAKTKPGAEQPPAAPSSASGGSTQQ